SDGAPPDLPSCPTRRSSDLDARAPEGAQLLAAHPQHVVAVNKDLAGGRLHEPVDVTNEGGLAGTRKAHHHENLASLDVERDVVEDRKSTRLNSSHVNNSYAV